MFIHLNKFYQISVNIITNFSKNLCVHLKWLSMWWGSQPLSKRQRSPESLESVTAVVGWRRAGRENNWFTYYSRKWRCLKYIAETLLVGQEVDIYPLCVALTTGSQRWTSVVLLGTSFLCHFLTCHSLCVDEGSLILQTYRCGRWVWAWGPDVMKSYHWGWILILATDRSHSPSCLCLL